MSGNGARARRRVRDQRGRVLHRQRGPQRAGKVAENWCVEDRAERQLAAQSRADLRRKAGGHERMPAEMEEMIRQAHALDAEQRGDQLAQHTSSGVAGAT